MAASEGARRPRRSWRTRRCRPSGSATTSKAFRAILERHGLEAGLYGHASVGCLHIRPFVDLTRPGGVETMPAVADEISTLVAEYDGVNRRARRRPRRAARSTRACSATSSTRRCREVKALFDPDDRLNPGEMVDAAPMTVGLRDPALPPAPPLRTHFAFERRDARRRRPLPAHRRLPQDRRGRDVPVLHGHPRGGARHARARQRAGQGALGARPARRARRRAAARDPRPLPRVQGVQERVPAERRHGDDEGGVPLALPGAARHPAALAAVRGDPAHSTGSARPPRRCRNLPAVPARAARARHAASTAAGRCRASRATTLLRWVRGARRGRAARAATSSSSPTRSPRSPSPRSGAPRSSCWSGGLATCGCESAGCCGRSSISKGLLDQARGDGRGDGGRGSRPRPSAASRSSAASRRAC